MSQYGRWRSLFSFDTQKLFERLNALLRHSGRKKPIVSRDERVFLCCFSVSAFMSCSWRQYVATGFEIDITTPLWPSKNTPPPTSVTQPPCSVPKVTDHDGSMEHAHFTREFGEFAEFLQELFTRLRRRWRDVKWRQRLCRLLDYILTLYRPNGLS